MTDPWGICGQIALRWMPLNLANDKWTLVQVMAWCHQATSHYLSQCWHRFMSPYGVTRPQSVKTDIGPSVILNSIDFGLSMRMLQLPVFDIPIVHWCIHPSVGHHIACLSIIFGSVNNPNFNMSHIAFCWAIFFFYLQYEICTIFFIVACYRSLESENDIFLNGHM